MTARSDAADAYAHAILGSQPPGADWVPDHGGPVTTDDIESIAAEAFAAGWDEATKRIQEITQ